MKHNREQLLFMIQVAKAFQDLWNLPHSGLEFWRDLSETTDRLMKQNFDFEVPTDWGYDDIVTWCRNELDKDDNDA